jgi:hypothetical protein
VFRSGGVNNEYRVIGENTDFEPHYNVINDPNEVQIYEMVMGDVNNNVTTVLERAKTYLKDNRLVPLGFSTSAGGLYDTTQIVGVTNDPDFNHINGIEGSGTDEVHYHIPVSGWNGNFHVSARLLYQTAPPKYMDEMFAFDTPEINTFRSMYDAQGPAPFEIALTESNFNVVGIGERKNNFNIFPNPSWDGRVNVQMDQYMPASFDLYDNNGKRVQKGYLSAVNNTLQLPNERGPYLLVIQEGKNKKLVKLVRK